MRWDLGDLALFVVGSKTWQGEVGVQRSTLTGVDCMKDCEGGGKEQTNVCYEVWKECVCKTCLCKVLAGFMLNGISTALPSSIREVEASNCGDSEACKKLVTRDTAEAHCTMNLHVDEENQRCQHITGRVLEYKQ